MFKCHIYISIINDELCSDNNTTRGYRGAVAWVSKDNIMDLFEQLVASLLDLSTLLPDDNNLSTTGNKHHEKILFANYDIFTRVVTHILQSLQL